MGPIPAIANIWYNPDNYRRPYDPNTGYYVDPQTGVPSPDVGPYSQPGWGQRVFNPEATQQLIAANERWINQARQARLNENIQVDRAGRDLNAMGGDFAGTSNGRALIARYGNNPLTRQLELTESDAFAKNAAGLPVVNAANAVNNANLIGERINSERQLVPWQLENSLQEQQYNVPATDYLNFTQTMGKLNREPNVQQLQAMQDEYDRRESAFRAANQPLDQDTQQLGKVLQNWNARNPMGAFGKQGMMVNNSGVTTFERPDVYSKDIQDIVDTMRIFGKPLKGMPNAPVSYNVEGIGTVANPHYTPIGGTQRGVPTASVNNGGGAGPLLNAPPYSGNPAVSAPAPAPAPAPSISRPAVQAPIAPLPSTEVGSSNPFAIRAYPGSASPQLSDDAIRKSMDTESGLSMPGWLKNSGLIAKDLMYDFLNTANPDNPFPHMHYDKGEWKQVGKVAAPAAAAGAAVKTNGMPIEPAKEVQPQELLPPPMQTPTNNPSSNPIEEVNVKNAVQASNTKKRRRQLIAPINPEEFYGSYARNLA